MSIVRKAQRRKLRKKAKVSRKQREFLTRPETRKAFVGGRGSGKTHSACLAGLLETGRGRCNGVYVAPTYPMVSDTVLPTWLEMARPVIEHHNKSNRTSYMVNGSVLRFRSAEDPDKLRGLTNSFFVLDEAAMVDRYVWRILLATLREGGGSGRAYLTTTPRGRRHWIYELFHDAPPSYHMTQATSWDNPFLSRELLEDLEREYGVGWFTAQELRGEFVDPAGALFHREWFRVTDVMPDEFEYVIRGWDLALTTKSTSDYTVGCKIGITADEDIYVLDVIRGKWEWPDARKVIIYTAVSDGEDCALGVERVAFQLAAVQELWDEPLLHNHTIEDVQSAKDKVSYALPLASRAKAGKVYLCAAPWNSVFLDELCSFDPANNGSNKDDQVDSFSIAHRGARKPEPQITWIR